MTLFIMRSSLSNSRITLICALQFLVSCRKDSQLTEAGQFWGCCKEEVCMELPPAPEIGYVYATQGVQYYTPFFNPLSNEEFICTRIVDGFQPELIKVNLETLTHEVLVSPMSLGRAVWGSDGWIIFQHGDGLIWKIREDGSLMTKVSNEYLGDRPEFAKDGTSFITMSYSSANFTIGYRPIFDLFGNLIDSSSYYCEGNITTGYPYFATSNKFSEGYFSFYDHDLTSSNGSGIAFKDMSNNLTVITQPISGDLTSFDIDSEKLIYTTYWGSMYLVNLFNSKIKTLRSGCKSRYYDFVSMTSNGEKAIFQKSTSRVTDDGDSVIVDNEIWCIDFEDCSEIRLLGD